MVLSGQPNAQAYAEMVRLTGLPREQFETFYWADRLDYDKGVLNGASYWQKFVQDAKLTLPAGTVEELYRQDVLHWSTFDPKMIAWQTELKQRGLITGILSNMGDSVHESIDRQFSWIKDFDVLVWSFQIGMIKPDAEIYHYLLKELKTKPEETLFLDDKAHNTDAARALGIQAIEFSTIARLREQLTASGLDRELPLPSE
jgi:putative hydrolase of the HAD superfamily